MGVVYVVRFPRGRGNEMDGHTGSATRLLTTKSFRRISASTIADWRRRPRQRGVLVCGKWKRIGKVLRPRETLKVHGFQSRGSELGSNTEENRIVHRQTRVGSPERVVVLNLS